MNIWFISDSGQVWDQATLERANTPELGGSIGGAEAMTVGLAHGLAARGHEVTIWAAHLSTHEEAYGQVHWRTLEGFYHQCDKPDVLVSVRQPAYFGWFPWECPRVLLAQDIYQPDHDAEASLADLTIYVSDWQCRQWPVPGVVTPVALDPAWIQPGLSRDERRHTFIYASRQERGLEPLLLMWPQIRRAISEARLLVTGYTAGVDIARADALLQGVPGVDIVRSDDKPGLFRQFARASLLLYPGESWFAETNGSICSQAMAAGVIPLVSRLGALPETVPERAGVLFNGDSRSQAYQDAFVAEVVRLSSPQADEEVLARQAFGYHHVLPRCDYAHVVTLWETWLHEACDRRTGHARRGDSNVLSAALHRH